MSLPTDQARALLDLNAELGEIAPHDVVGAASHALDALCRLTDTEDGFLVFSVQALSEERHTDPLLGWRPVHSLYKRRTDQRPRPGADYYRDQSSLLDDEYMQAHARLAGKPRAFLSRDLLGAEAWDALPFVRQVLVPLGIEDRVLAGIPLSPGLDLSLGLDRYRHERLTARERDFAAVAVSTLRWLWSQLAVSLGLPDRRLPPLSPREAETLEALLQGHDARTLAAQLGVAQPTLNSYVRAVYAKLGVRSRSELMAEFVGRSRSELMAEFVGRPVPIPLEKLSAIVYESPPGLPLVFTELTQKTRSRRANPHKFDE